MPSRETDVTRPLHLRPDGFGGRWGDKAMEKMIRDVLRIEDEYYILAKSALADDRTHVLKHGDTFAVFDRYGDIQPLGLGEQGLYHGCTRFLSRLELRFWGKRPLLLGSLVKEDNSILSVDLANPDIAVDGEVTVPRNSIHIFRRKLIRNGACHERLCLRNYSRREVTVPLSLHFEADFRDIFEVRGARRSRRGKHRKPDRKSPGVHFAYRGLDGRTRDTWIRTDPEPETRSPAEMHFAIRLRPKRESNVSVTVHCGLDGIRTRPAPFPRAYAGTRHAFERFTAAGSSLVTSNDLFNEWIGRSLADLHMMISETGEGPYPHAGVPWFSTAFGRDGILAAMQFLWVNPSPARGVLSYLAKRQAREKDPQRDAEPGKILHEVREGEMAAMGEVPFGLYYGSVDATPLFVILAGMYLERTGDRDFVRSIWPNIERALEWIDTHGDADGDGFVEYENRSPGGLIHQGWKDSRNAVFHRDGRDARGPIALCEVQAYVYAAKRWAAGLAAELGKTGRATELVREARALKERFEKAFWCEEISTYALALDGDKTPCRVRTSNAGHCLFAGIAGRRRALRTAGTLLDRASFSGWGIRTVAATETAYNPMSYHNGSVWPHDNSLIAHGFARYGLKAHAQKVVEALFDAAVDSDLRRLPELFCGFHRRTGEGLTIYPLSCSPQAWSAASVFLCLQACLGLLIDASKGRVSLHRPVLPAFLTEVRIGNLAVGRASIDVTFRRNRRRVGVDVTRRKGSVDIMVTE